MPAVNLNAVNKLLNAIKVGGSGGAEAEQRGRVSLQHVSVATRCSPLQRSVAHRGEVLEHFRRNFVLVGKGRLLVVVDHDLCVRMCVCACLCV